MGTFNYEIICKVLHHVWALSIAMDAGTKGSVPYLDVSLRCILCGKLFNIHLVAFPMYERHTGLNTFVLISRFLDALCEKWKKNIISVLFVGASNMHGRHQGAVTRYKEVCSDGFYRIWCGAHPLDLVVQAIFVQMLNKLFIEKTHHVTGHLRRQQNLVREMKMK
jgi:hypothetical protein